MQAARRGDELHDYAQRAIKLGIRQADNGTTLSTYVNDAIGWRMTPEQKLFYSFNAYGTADAISFSKNILRIHDLKTGIHPGVPEQLEVYAALFCHEYDYRPFNIKIELRIYQNDAVHKWHPDPGDIFHHMEKIATFDRLITDMKKEALL